MVQYAKVPVSQDARSELVTSLLFRAIGHRSPSVAVQSEDLWYFVPTNDVLGRQTFLSGGFEDDVMEAAMRIVQKLTGHLPLPGKTFIDIGANIGTSCIPAVRTFGALDALAFEPASTNLRLLRANRAANDLDERIRIVPLALSDTSGLQALERGEDDCGDFRIRVAYAHGAIGEHRRDTEEVKTETFDEIIRQFRVSLDDVGLVWIDTQGHEAHVLAGASSLTSSHVPVVAEYWPYGLRRAGALERFHSLVEKHYGTIVDVRSTMQQGTTAEIMPTDVLALSRRYHPARYWQYTDLLLLK